MSVYEHTIEQSVSRKVPAKAPAVRVETVPHWMSDDSIMVRN